MNYTRKVSVSTNGLCEICNLGNAINCCKLCNNFSCVLCTKYEYFCFFCGNDKKKLPKIQRILNKKKKKELYKNHTILQYLCYSKNKKTKVKPI